MKTKLVLVLFISISFLTRCSCNTVDDIVNDVKTISITQNFDDTISINETTSGIETGTWTETIVFDLTQDPDYEANKDRINDITLNAFSFKIANYIGSDTAIMSNTTVSFGDRVIEVNQDINLKDYNDSGDPIPVGDAADYDAFVTILKAEHKITLTISGDLNETAVTFDIDFVAESTIKFLAI